MSFTPTLPMTGYTGWMFLQRTMQRQQETMQKTASNVRDEEYFKKNIGNVKNANDLVSDQRLLRIALTAFGLESDVKSQAFVKKVLGDDLSDAKALANRLSDKKYLAFATTFGLNKGSESNVAKEGFADEVLQNFRNKSFQVAVGNENASFRIALNLQNELVDIANSSATEDTKWYTIMGSIPLRTVFEKAFGLPTSFGQVDIGIQLATLKKKAQSVFGESSISQFADKEKLEKLTKTYLIRDELSQNTTNYSKSQIALQLLSSR